MNSKLRMLCAVAFLLVINLTISCSQSDPPKEPSINRTDLSEAFPLQTRAPEDFSAFQQMATQKRRLAIPAAYKPFLRTNHPVETNDVLGVPSVLWTSKDAILAVKTKQSGQNSVREQSRAYLDFFSPLYRQGSDDLKKVSLRYISEDAQGPIIAKYHQEIDGVPIIHQSLNVLMNQNRELVAISGYLSPQAGDVTRVQFDLNIWQAVEYALYDLTGEELFFDEITELTPQGRFHFLKIADDKNATLAYPLERPVQMHKVFYQMPDELVPAYHMVIQTQNPLPRGSDSYAYVISAADGAVLMRRNLVSSSHSYRVWADPADNFIPHPGPYGGAISPHPTRLPDSITEPPYIAPELVTLDYGPISTGDPWLPDGAQETVGNNVDAYVDRNEPDGLSVDNGDFRASVTSDNTFNRVFDFNAEPTATTDQQMAVVTQLFYTINYLHDWFYDAGFDEVAGNAQMDNYGRGGEAGDVLLAEAQDYSGTNNANMTTPPDGYSPRMQQYLFAKSSERYLIILSPESIAGSYPMAAAEFGPDTFDFTGDVVLANDGTAVTTDGCEPLKNGGNMVNQVALIDRGSCTFNLKVENAQNALAKGAIIVNDSGAELSDMAGENDSVSIPSVRIDITTGDLIKDALAWGDAVSVRLYRQDEIDWRDSGIDNSVVAHEWGHYLHKRLTDSNSNQSRAISEGWGDTLAALLAVKEGDDQIPGNENFGGVYPVFSGYSDDEYYFTIRRYPLSTNMTDYNPLTFHHIMDGVPLPEGPALNASGVPNSEVHAAGEIWSAMMWELYVTLLTRDDLTFKAAQDRMKKYIVAGMKMTPKDATFTESRDALLAVAAAGDPVDFERFSQAFARRGMGEGAVAPDRYSTDFSGVVESYVPFDSSGVLEFADAQITETVSCDLDGIPDAGESAIITVRLTNTGYTALENVTAEVTSDADVTMAGNGAIAFDTIPPGATVAGIAGVTLGASNTDSTLEMTVTYSDAVAGTPQKQQSVSFEMNRDIVANSTLTADAECGMAPWTAQGDVGTVGVWQVVETGPESHIWYGPDAAGVSDQSLVSPAFVVSGDDGFAFTFAHRFSFEPGGFDGGVVELSVDGGQSWLDVGNAMTVGYTGLLANDVNPIYEPGRTAFVNASPGYPDFVTETVNLSGAGLAGETAQIRFRVGCDAAVAGDGWEIDNIVLSGVTSSPFPQKVAEADSCTPTPGVIVSQNTDAETWENGDAAQFSVNLATAPTADVTVGVSVSDSTEGSVSPASLVFTPDNWAAPQPVTVTGVDDAEKDGNITYAVGFQVTSDDAVYEALAVNDVEFVNKDDDNECPSSVDGTALIGTAQIGGDVSINLQAVNQTQWEIRYELTDSEDGVFLSGDTTTYLLENITAQDTDVTIRAHGIDASQEACFDEITLPIAYEPASSNTVAQTPDTVSTPVALGTLVTIEVNTIGASLATINGTAMTPDDDTLPRINHWTYNHRALASETLDVAAVAPGASSPIVVDTVDIHLQTGVCPSGADASAFTGNVTMGDSATIELQGANATAFEVEYNGEAVNVYDSTSYEITEVTGDGAAVIVRAWGTDATGAPCTDTATIPLPFVAAIASNLSQTPDTQMSAVPYGTWVLLGLDTAGANSVTVNGVAMTPDYDAAFHHLNHWSLWHEALASETLSVSMTAPGQTAVAGGAFDIALTTSVGCPDNVDQSTIDGTAVLGGALGITLTGDNVDTFKVDYNGQTYLSQLLHILLHDQTPLASSDTFIVQQSDIYGGIYSCQAADDFTVPAGEAWQLTTVTVMGQASAKTHTATVVIHSGDNGGIPGAVLASFESVPATDDGSGNLTISLETEAGDPLLLAPGNYWMSYTTVRDYETAGLWYGVSNAVQSGYPAVWQNPGNGWQTGCTSWAPLADCLEKGPDIAFSLSGIIENDTPQSHVVVLTGISANAPTATVRGIGRDSGGGECTALAQLELPFETAQAISLTQTPNSIPGGFTAGTEMLLSVSTIGAGAVTLNGVAMTPAVDAAVNRENIWTAIHTVGNSDETLQVAVTTPGVSPAVADADIFRIRSVCHNMDCSAQDDCHGDGVCNPASGSCDFPALANGTVCDDENACTQLDSCWGGTCVGGNTISCECFEGGGCDAATGECVGTALADGASCGDGDACYSGECTWLEEGDSCDGAVRIQVGEPYTGDLAEKRANGAVPASCIESGRTGKDAFHAVDLVAGQMYTIQVTPNEMDASLILWPACVFDDTCMAAADAGGLQTAERISSFSVAHSQTVYIQVLQNDDGADGSDTASDNTPLSSGYTLLVQTEITDTVVDTADSDDTATSTPTDTETDTSQKVDTGTDENISTDVNIDTNTNVTPDTANGSDTGVTIVDTETGSDSVEESDTEFGTASEMTMDTDVVVDSDIHPPATDSALAGDTGVTMGIDTDTDTDHAEGADSGTGPSLSDTATSSPLLVNHEYSDSACGCRMTRRPTQQGALFSLLMHLF